MKQDLIFLEEDYIQVANARLSLAKWDIVADIALAESLPIQIGKPQHLAEHLARLAEGCRALAWKDPDLKRVGSVLSTLPQKNKLKAGSLRLRYWGGLAKPLLFAQTLPARPLPKGGIRLMTTAVRHYGPDSLNGRAKAATMLPNWLAKAESEAWAEDGLRLTPDGMVAEGVWSNIVAVKNGVARTPPLHSGVLEGVTRAQLLAALKKKGLQVREEPVTRYDLWTADEVWVSSSLRGALRVKEVDGRSLGK